TYECARAAKRHAGTCRAGGLGAARAERIVGQEFLKRVAEPYAKHVESAPSGRLGSAPPRRDLTAELAAVDRKLEALIELSVESPGPGSVQAFRRKAEQLERKRGELIAEQARSSGSAELSRQRRESFEALRARLADLPAIWSA